MYDGNAAVAKRRWVSAVGVTLLVFVAGIVGGIVSHRLDANGTRAQNTPLGKGVVLPAGGLLFRSSTGKLVAKLDADQNGGSLILYNTNEKPTIIVTATQAGGGLIGLTGSGKGSVLQLAGNEDGGSIVLFSAKRGKRVLELIAGDDGGSMSLKGPTGDPAVTIETTESGRKIEGKIDILDSISGKVLWSAPADGSRRAR